MASNDTDNDNDGFVFGHQPIAWILIPLIVILVLGLTATIIQVRRRRRLRGNLWPGNDPRAPASSGRGNRTTNRRAPWAGTRSEEGLNELGQAPPPYDGKKETQNPLELRDLEAGSSPPEYPAEPPPAVVSDGRRN
ncbi:hypothetical protein NW762_003884 [Fusarium torreyae]|uniref:Uncharacterized protein n=1 Tax=Fusarium torreyae TaxID=1237075 RepID=A0A9W8VM40_9HYPO|nr:hypothetical protein NW762_003884 [Fusarium torreyae]